MFDIVRAIVRPFSGLWGSGPPVATQRPADAPATNPDAPAKPQKPLKRDGAAGYYADAGRWNPTVRPDVPDGNYATYVWMSRCPELAIAFQTIVNPILSESARPKVKIRPKDGGKPVDYKRPGPDVTVSPEDKRAAALCDAFGPQWSYLLLASARMLQYGHSLMDVEYGRAAGTAAGIVAPTRFRRFKPGDPGLTIWKDAQGDFAGFRYNGQERDPRYAFNAVNFPDEDPIFGLSNHENVRAEWWEKFFHKTQGRDLARLANSIVPIIMGPPGAEGREGGKKIATALANREPVWMEQYLLDMEDVSGANLEALKYAAYKVETVKLQDTGPAQAAVLEMLRYLDSELMMGWYLASLQAMEAQHATRAQASVHEDANVTYSELVYGSIIEQLNAGPVRTTCLTNWGASEAGRYFFEAPELYDADRAYKQDVLKDALSTPGAPVQADAEALAREIGVPVKAMAQGADLGAAGDQGQGDGGADGQSAGDYADPPPVNGNGDRLRRMGLSGAGDGGCGSGAGGFKPGNHCQKGGSGEAADGAAPAARGSTPAARFANQMGDYAKETFRERLTEEKSSQEAADFRSVVTQGFRALPDGRPGPADIAAQKAAIDKALAALPADRRAKVEAAYGETLQAAAKTAVHPDDAAADIRRRAAAIAAEDVVLTSKRDHDVDIEHLRGDLADDLAESGRVPHEMKYELAKAHRATHGRQGAEA